MSTAINKATLAFTTINDNFSYLDNKIDNVTNVINFSYYGTCATAATTQAKVVVCPEFTELKEGMSIRVKFTNAQTYNGQATLNVNSTGAKGIVSNGTTKAVRYCWAAGEVVSFTYDGTNWVMEDAGIATTSYYGYTKLSTSAVSTNASSALTPASLNSLVQDMIADYPVYSTSSTYAVGDRVRASYQVWECIVPITTAEAWTAAHWKALDPIQTQIDNLKNGLSYTATCPAITPVDGVATWSVTHSLGTENIQATLYSGGNEIVKNVSITSSNTISIQFKASSNVTAGSYKVVITGV